MERIQTRFKLLNLARHSKVLFLAKRNNLGPNTVESHTYQLAVYDTLRSTIEYASILHNSKLESLSADRGGSCFDPSENFCYVQTKGISGSHDSLIVVGGRLNPKKCQKLVSFNDEWKPYFMEPVRQPRVCSSLAFVGDCDSAVVVTGSADGQASRTCEIYRSGEGWTQLPELN